MYIYINIRRNSFTNETTGYPLTKHKMMIMSSIVLILNVKWKNTLSLQNANESVALNNHIISIKALHQMLVSLSSITYTRQEDVLHFNLRLTITESH